MYELMPLLVGGGGGGEEPVFVVVVVVALSTRIFYFICVLFVHEKTCVVVWSVVLFRIAHSNSCF